MILQVSQKNLENLPYVDATTGGIYLFFII